MTPAINWPEAFIMATLFFSVAIILIVIVWKL